MNSKIQEIKITADSLKAVEEIHKLTASLDKLKKVLKPKRRKFAMNLFRNIYTKLLGKPSQSETDFKCCDVCTRNRAKGRELHFISVINRDGSGTSNLEGVDMSHLNNTEFVMNSLSITKRTYVACGFNSYVVRFKKFTK